MKEKLVWNATESLLCASFPVLLESLKRRLGGKDQFKLEQASIDGLYLDITTTYCYNHQALGSAQVHNDDEDNPHNTVVA
jgi:hypothetical protein